ncbi:Hypothetical_protein [Hexamita inflata]|uniref:Hypothetical_protein n=1 Tax=Hexamita inflata TaxID=28002 RepID=A0AA86R8A6_9EUKA|nr:Hypothetical protein HINF_LOCUS61249 [Hexamita inflata]
MIDLRLLKGQYDQLILKNCKFQNQVKSLQVNHLIIQSKVDISLFIGGDYSKIDVEVNDNARLANFVRCGYLTNLNSLSFQNTNFDVSILEGQWNTVEFSGCLLYGHFSSKFASKTLIYDMYSQDMLLPLFQNYTGKLQLNYSAWSSVNFRYFHQLNSSQLSLSFFSCEIDFSQFWGNYYSLVFKECMFTPVSTVNIQAQNLVFIRCYPKQTYFKSFKATFCSILNAKVHQVPNAHEISLVNSTLNLKFLSPVYILNFKNVKIVNIPSRMLQNVKQFTFSGKKNMQANDFSVLVQKRKKHEEKLKYKSVKISEVRQQMLILKWEITYIRAYVQYISQKVEDIGEGLE